MMPTSLTTVDAGETRGGPTTILQVGPLMKPLEVSLQGEFSVVRLPQSGHQDFLDARTQKFELAVTSGKVGVKGDLIRALPELRAIVNFGVGYDATDVATAREHGVAISNTPDVLTDCVADIAIGLVIDAMRGISAADRFVRRGQWTAGSFPLATKVTGKRIGIVGLGRIGRAIAKRLEGFNATVAYHSRRQLQDVAYEYVGSVEELASRSDVLIVAAAGGPNSAGLVSREVLAALGPQGFLVNIARGSVVDQHALIDALVEGTIAGAGLDVFADEPRVPQELMALENVVLLPHLASGTIETRQAMSELVIANVRQFVADGTLRTPIF